ncbi:outer membrane beta-barrel protein [Myroides sp. N17-2]|uniref:outer membrane beta-barrel protein n=1 Tax=Myroides sp. N17-2 TaxID=2030799 RepID=UPI000EFCD6B2|nr:outer membrane beta-barrel protein [Myroides sp. N17-2]
MNKKIIYTGIVALLSCYTSQAQELGVFTSSHFSNTINNPTGSKAVVGNGFNVGVSYGQYLSKNFSIQIEPSYSQYHTQSRIDNFKGNLSTVDRDNDAFILRYQGSNLKEKVTMKQLNIPIMLQYETAGESVRFFVKSGVSYGLQLEDAVSRTKMSSLRTSGYYSEYDVELFEPSFVGFGNFNGASQKNGLELKNRWSYVAEIGVKQLFNDKSSVYVGMYFDIGLNNLTKDIAKDNGGATSLVGYDRDLDNPLLINSTLTSNTEKITYKNYNIGVKVKYSFNFSKTKKKGQRFTSTL